MHQNFIFKNKVIWTGKHPLRVALEHTTDVEGGVGSDLNDVTTTMLKEVLAQTSTMLLLYDVEGGVGSDLDDVTATMLKDVLAQTTGS